MVPMTCGPTLILFIRIKGCQRTWYNPNLLFKKIGLYYSVTKFPNLSKVCVNLKKTQILFSRKLVSNMLLENFQICWMDV